MANFGAYNEADQEAVARANYERDTARAMARPEQPKGQVHQALNDLSRANEMLQTQLDQLEVRLGFVLTSNPSAEAGELIRSMGDDVMKEESSELADHIRHFARSFTSVSRSLGRIIERVDL
jgi:uncharacterized membrane protein YccC